MNHPGTLALVGSGEYLPPMDPVDRLLLSRVRGPRVVCLPTAAGTEGAAVVGRWARMGVEHFTRLGVPAEAVGVVDRASAEDENLAARIRAANFVYLSGGRPNFLYHTLQGTRAYAAILSVLERGGVVAGCSAGAMIWGGALLSFNPLRPFERAFSLVPEAVILPHFDEFPAYLMGALRLIRGRRTLIGVDGDTALVSSAGTAVAAGAGTVTVMAGGPPARYRAGQRIPL